MELNEKKTKAMVIEQGPETNIKLVANGKDM